jgi:hypothetical protein
MTRRLRLWRIVVIATLACSAGTAAFSDTNNKKKNKDEPQAQKSYDRPTDPSLYVGSDTCKTCHEDIFKNFETTPHWKTTFTKKGPEWQGCEACHGPGKEHVEGGGDKSKIFTF